MTGPGEYHIGDARDLPEFLPEQAAVVVADLAWARPHRYGSHTTYPTYGSDDGLWDFVDAAYAALEPGGWAFFDADDWFLPRLVNYLRENWGDVAATYDGGGYRRTGTVVYENLRGGGHYFTNGGYHVVMAHKSETDRTSDIPAKLSVQAPRDWGWGTPKPVAPYRRWIASITDSDDLIAIPCAGSAPAGIAAEQLYGDSARFVAVDSEPEARDAYLERRKLQVSLAGSAAEVDW